MVSSTHAWLLQVLLKTGLLSKFVGALARCLCPGGGGKSKGGKDRKQKQHVYDAPSPYHTPYGYYGAAPLQHSKVGACRGAWKSSPLFFSP